MAQEIRFPEFFLPIYIVSMPIAQEVLAFPLLDLNNNWTCFFHHCLKLYQSFTLWILKPYLRRSRRKTSSIGINQAELGTSWPAEKQRRESEWAHTPAVNKTADQVRLMLCPVIQIHSAFGEKKGIQFQAKIFNFCEFYPLSEIDKPGY